MWLELRIRVLSSQLLRDYHQMRQQFVDEAERKEYRSMNVLLR